MNYKLLVLSSILLFALSSETYAQAPNLGTAANFILFTSNGAVTNTGTTVLTGNIGTNSGGSATGFGNVNGVIHVGDGASAQCASDLLLAYNQLNNAIPTHFPASLLGNGQVLTAGIYSIGSATTLDLTLTLDGQQDSNAVFIFKIQGSFSTGAAAKVKLINGALACNVFWKIEGLVNMATGTSMKGTVIANNAAIVLNVNDTLEGRAMSTTGAVTVHGIVGNTPTGCGSVVLTGPAAPALASAECYAIFSGSGSVMNSGVTHVTGDVGTNSGTTTGFNSAFVTGTVHTVPDASTVQCAADLHNTYTYLNNLPYDIQLMYPAQFGNNLVLTPHTYWLNAATVLTDTVFLDAQNDSNAVFVMKINGAFSTGTYSYVKLLNGAQAKNVFWKVEGAASINNYSVFCGTMIVNNGSITMINTGVQINGRAFTTTGSITTASITAIMPPGCSNGPPTITTQPISQSACADSAASFSVIAHGTSLAYQWRKGHTFLTNTGNISGANAAILTINPVSTSDTSSFYNVIITGSSAPNDTSVNVSLSVNNAPVITTAPTNQTTCAGTQATFTVAATGDIVSYQWRKGTINLVNGANISGATLNHLIIDSVSLADSSSHYNVIVSGVCTNDTSANVYLHISGASIVAIAPLTQTICAGATANFSVVTTGTVSSYVWRRGTTVITNSSTVSGATTNRLTVNSATLLDSSSFYNVIITDACGKDTSINVVVKVNSSPVITSEPVTQNTCVGGTVSFAVTTTGPALSYQWKKGTTILTNGGHISGATTGTLSVSTASAADSSSFYNVIVGGSCRNDTSVYAALVINGTPVVVTAPVSQVVCNGSPVTFSTMATGAISSYQWRKGNNNLVDGGNISGSTLSTLTFSSVSMADSAADYNVIIDGLCGSDTSADVSLILCATGIASIDNTDMLSVYPNPFTNSIHVSINQPVGANGVQFIMYNMLGDEVVKTNLTNMASEIKTSALSGGVYFYQVIENGKTIQIGKLVSQQ